MNDIVKRLAAAMASPEGIAATTSLGAEMKLYPYQQKLIDHMLKYPDFVISWPRQPGRQTLLMEYDRLEQRILAIDPATPGTDRTVTATGRLVSKAPHTWVIDEVSEFKKCTPYASGDVIEYKGQRLLFKPPVRYNKAPRRQATTSYRARRRTDRRARHAAKMANIRKARK